jgi:hypothetical protein
MNRWQPGCYKASRRAGVAHRTLFVTGLCFLCGATAATLVQVSNRKKAQSPQPPGASGSLLQEESSARAASASDRTADWFKPEVRDGVPYIPKDVALDIAAAENARWAGLLERLAQ